MGSTEEFGRRSLEAQMRTSDVAQEGDHFPERVSRNEGAATGAAPGLIIQFVVVACLAFGGATVYALVLKPGAGPVAVEAANAIPVNNTPVPASDLEVVRRACQQAMDNAGKLEEANSREGFLDINIMKSGVKMAMTLSSAYINCLMSNNPRRLCAKADKADLVAAIHEHLVVVKAGPALSDFAAKSISRAQRRAEKGGGDPFGPGDDGAPAEKSAPITAFDEQMTYNLRGLAAVGIIKAADFAALWGTTIPGDITAVLDGVRVVKQECPSQGG